MVRFLGKEACSQGMQPLQVENSTLPFTQASILGSPRPCANGQGYTSLAYFYSPHETDGGFAPIHGTFQFGSLAAPTAHLTLDVTHQRSLSCRSTTPIPLADAP
jgi:hypothetical protein